MNAWLHMSAQIGIEVAGVYESLPAARARILFDKHLPRSRCRMPWAPDAAVIREHQVAHPLTARYLTEIDEPRTTVRLTSERQPKPGPGERQPGNEDQQ